MRFCAPLLLAASICLTAPVQAIEIQCEDTDANLQTYLEMTDILFNQRQAERAPEYYAAEFISHNTDAGGLGTVTRTPDHMTGIWTRQQALFPDRKVTNELIVCKGDLVIARTGVQGTMNKPAYGQEPTGNRFHYSAIDIYRFKDGKVVERWGNNDRVAFAKQLGITLDLTPTPLESQ